MNHLFLFKRKIAIALFAFVFSFHTKAQNSFAVQATIENGTIEGLYDVKSGLQTYFGIPYAKPPIGNLRWKAPQPLDHWKGVLTTKAFAAGPVQAPVFGDIVFRGNGLSEDCLYLNVWTPAKRNDKNLPVLVYFHGMALRHAMTVRPWQGKASWWLL